MVKVHEDVSRKKKYMNGIQYKLLEYKPKDKNIFLVLPTVSPLLYTFNASPLVSTFLVHLVDLVPLDLSVNPAEEVSCKCNHKKVKI